MRRGFEEGASGLGYSMTPTLSHDAAKNIPRFLIQQCPVWSGKMTAGGDGFAAVVGGPALHIPVLGRPALDFLNVRDGGVYIDATFGVAASQIKMIE